MTKIEDIKKTVMNQRYQQIEQALTQEITNQMQRHQNEIKLFTHYSDTKEQGHSENQRYKLAYVDARGHGYRSAATFSDIKKVANDMGITHITETDDEVVTTNYLYFGPFPRKVKNVQYGKVLTLKWD